MDGHSFIRLKSNVALCHKLIKKLKIMKKANSFKIENEAIIVPRGVHKNQKPNEVLITFSSLSGIVYQFELPKREMVGLKKDQTISSIFSTVSLVEPLSKQRSKQLLSFLNENLKSI